MSLKSNLMELEKTIPQGVKLVIVSKIQPASSVQELYDAGHRSFGENKAQEITSKYELLPRDIEWHFIGHLQTNKIKYIAPFVSLIHSIDSQKVLTAVNLEAAKNNRIINCLLEFHIATEETKFGFDIREAEELLNSEEYKTLKNVRITGVMGMASFSDDHELVRQEFRALKGYYDRIKSNFFSIDEDFREISMGMSGDYMIAIEEGSTIVRIGTAIFGERNYNK